MRVAHRLGIKYWMDGDVIRREAEAELQAL
jgi:hypothetical protein